MQQVQHVKRHVLAAKSQLQASMCSGAAGYTDDVRKICWASATVYCKHGHAEFEVDMAADSQPGQHHQALRDVVANIQLVDETCCSNLDALKWLVYQLLEAG